MAEQTLSMFELDEEKFIFTRGSLIFKEFSENFVINPVYSVRLCKPASAKLHIILSYDLSEP